ncbi:MAG: hypothetical protein LBO75_04670, partial [Bifidobacteriaceae bacterium]|nr:hypothetical protein [Bifidobacteriaceae bacterium]
MKKTLLVAAAVSLVTALTGCASNSDPAPSPSASPLDAVSWVEGDPPSLEFKTPFQLKSSSAFKVVKEGDGAEVKPGWLVQVHYVEVNGATGGVLDSTYQQGGPQTYLMAETAPEGDPIWPALKDQKVGARLIVAFATAAAEEPNQSPSAPTMTALLALTITDIQPLPEEESPKPAPDTEGR